jgi:ectoine hydroxylase-related dioxygenase (phytanoyl-CoA dioxygenase family)
VLEEDGKVVRSIYGSHMTNSVFDKLTRHPKLVRPVEKILDSEIYVYQFKINAKLALKGDVWAWHQDFIFWLCEDGMQSPRVMNAVVFLADVNEFNGPMFIVPGSHHEGAIEASTEEEIPDAYAGNPAWISNLTAKLKYTVDQPALSRLVERYGIVAPKGPRGSVLFFHPNIVHASSPNLSPYDRPIAIITYNSVKNVPPPVERPRPDFLASRDCRPIVALEDEAMFLDSAWSTELEAETVLA